MIDGAWLKEVTNVEQDVWPLYKLHTVLQCTCAARGWSQHGAGGKRYNLGSYIVPGTNLCVCLIEALISLQCKYIFYRMVYRKLSEVGKVILTCIPVLPCPLHSLTPLSFLCVQSLCSSQWLHCDQKVSLCQQNLQGVLTMLKGALGITMASILVGYARGCHGILNYRDSGLWIFVELLPPTK